MSSVNRFVMAFFVSLLITSFGLTTGYVAFLVIHHGPTSR